MKHKRLLNVVFFSVALILAFASLRVPAVIAADVIEIKVGSFDPVQHPFPQSRVYFCEEVEKRTGGKIKFKWYHAGSLVKPPQTYEALKSGVVDMVSNISTWAFERQYPISTVLNLPFVVDSTSHGALTFYKAYQAIPEIQKEWSDVKIYAFNMVLPMNISTVGPPPKTPDEMKGLKLFAGSAMMVEMVKLLGATPVNLKLEDVYMALQRKTIDGVTFPLPATYAWKLTDSANGHLIFNAGSSVIPGALRIETWKSLPPDVQKVFDDLILSSGCFTGAAVDAEADWVTKKLKERGDTIYVLSPEEKEKWKRIFKPVYDNWIAGANAKGINGQAIFDKVLAIAEETRRNPYKGDAWWKRELLEKQ